MSGIAILPLHSCQLKEVAKKMEKDKQLKQQVLSFHSLFSFASWGRGVVVGVGECIFVLADKLIVD